ncbi:MAG: beta-lactamase family protein [Xanthomonadales bacterium]|jgi:CubicO group peptidase (beta-lactamase class C family)|nr:beta-lactamase family protein [Xanthomonadales bacterium]
MRILSLAALLCLTSTSPAQTVDYQGVNTRVQQLLATAPLPGASVSLIRDDQVVYRQAFGSYSVTQRVAIASATKWLSGAVILRLVDRGVLRLDDPIGRWLPEAPADKQPLTLRQLFSHTSGLTGADAGCLGQSTGTLAACTAQILTLPLLAPPGTRFAYGGNSMQVAGRIAEVATGKRWDLLFREEVAEPLGMVATDYGFTSSAPGLIEVDNPRIAGGARSTLDDYTRFLSAMLARGRGPDGRIWLSPALVDQLEANQDRGAAIGFTPLPTAVGYGIGVFRERVDVNDRATRVSHAGAFGFYPVLDRAGGWAGVFLTQAQLQPVLLPVQALWDHVQDLHTAGGPPTPRLRVDGAALGGGAVPVGAATALYARAPTATERFAGWLGDGPALIDPRGGRQDFAMPARDLTLAARFEALPALASPLEDRVNASTYRWLLPAAPRGLVFAFHGTGGSGDLPFRKTEARRTTQLLLARGFGVVGLDSVNRVDRQWNPQVALSNPDVVNVQAILSRFRAEGRIGAETPVFCEGTSNGGGFCSRISALLGFRGQSLMISDGVQAVLAQSRVPTFWTLGRNDPVLAPGSIERARAAAESYASRGVPAEVQVVEPSVVYPDRLARVDGVSVEQSRMLVAQLSSAGVLAADGRVLRTLSAAELRANLTPALEPQAAELAAQLQIAAAEHEYFGDVSHRVVHFFEAQLTPDLSGLWWQPSQPGWGLSIAMQGGRPLPAWYTYDAAGRPQWLLGEALSRGADGVWRGALLRYRGTPFAQIRGDAAAQGTRAGSVTLALRDDGALDFGWTLDGVSGAQRVERLRFGRVPACRQTPDRRVLSANRSDLWWNPRQSGWGVWLAEQDRTLLLLWYTYATDGAPMWVLGELARDREGRFRGRLTRPASGMPFDRITGAATDFPVPTVGNAELVFVDGERAALDATLDGVRLRHDLERFVYAGPEQSDCQ